MKLTKLIKLGLCAVLALLPMACSQDRLEDLEPANTKPEAGTTISFEGLNFSLENDSELRYINSGTEFEFVENSKGHIVPFPSLTDGKKVPITVAIADVENELHAYLHTFATYDAATKGLTLEAAEYKLINGVSGKVLNNEDSTFFSAGKEYYMCAVLGGTPIKSIKPGMEADAFYKDDDDNVYYPADPQSVYEFEWTRYMTSDRKLRLWDVRFEYNDVLTPIQRQVGEKLNMDIAYYTPWTKLDVVNVVDEKAGDHRVVTFSKKGLQFKPHGNILAIQVGNRTNKDVTIDGINIVSYGTALMSFGGYIPLNLDDGAIDLDNAYPPFVPGVYTDDLSIDKADGIFRLSESIVLKANQRQQYTFYIWITRTPLEQTFRIDYMKDGKIAGRPRVPLGKDWVRIIELQGRGGDYDFGKIYVLETSL